jgi:N-acetylglucosaminyldiphosphoundecaprenol N-acetyl-beta-D-mannosaminyltransferase
MTIAAYSFAPPHTRPVPEAEQGHALPAAWPGKLDLFGVGITPTCYDEVVDVVLRAAAQRRGGMVDLMSVHGLAMASRDGSFRRCVNAFDLVAPDGQPVRWALNRFHDAGLNDRVYGPELMLRLCDAARRAGTGVYLYGGTTTVLDKLNNTLVERFPGLRIAGAESPPFRALTAEEDAAAVQRINASGAGIVFIGVGCPKQEIFASEHRDRIAAVQVCVGAAFDFHAGHKRLAPPWMQQRGLEWLFRLWQEPGRLWRRYLVANTIFSLLVGRRLLLGH